MNPMLPSRTWISRALAISLCLAPAIANAQTLPKGYASDENPSAPAATAPASTAAAPAANMQPASADGASATATAQISTSTDEYADTDPSALTDFNEPLQGYGTWVVDDTYGTVWVPDSAIVGSDFAPYQTGGYWSMTDEGEWLWVSTYDWGYVPFHYGRWIWISGLGWSWIPGRTYAPSWVVWRTSDYGYIGWAPMPPTYYWYGGSVVYFTTVPAAAYVFCPTTHVFHTSVHSYVVHDKATVQKVAAHSRNYKPAQPTASTADHKSPDSSSSSKTHSSASATAKAGAAGGVSAVRKPVGPSLKEAGVPDSAAPKTRGKADSRAAMFSKKSTTAKAKTLVKTQRAALGSAGNSPALRTSTSTAGSTAATAVRRPASRAGTGTTIAANAGRRSGPAAGGYVTTPSAGGSAATRAQNKVIRTPSATRGQSGSPGVQPIHRGGSRSSVSTPTPSVQPATSAAKPAAKAAAKPAARSTPAVTVPRASAPAATPKASAPRSTGGGRRH